MNDKLLQAELENIVDESNDNIVVTDGNGIVLRVSKNCFDIYGLEKDQLIGRSVYELEEEGIFSPSITVKVLKERKRMQSMQKTQTNRHIMTTGIPVLLDGKIERVISFSHDLTEIQQLCSAYEDIPHNWSFPQLEKEGLTLQQALQRVEKGWLEQAYASSSSTYEMARNLGTSQSTIVRRLKQYNIKSK